MAEPRAVSSCPLYLSHVRREGSPELDLLESEEEGEFLPKGLEELVVGPEPLALGGKGHVRWTVPWEDPAMGEADSRAPDRMGGVDPWVEHLEEVARLWVSTEYLIRN